MICSGFTSLCPELENLQQWRRIGTEQKRKEKGWWQIRLKWRVVKSVAFRGDKRKGIKTGLLEVVFFFYFTGWKKRFYLNSTKKARPRGWRYPILASFHGRHIAFPPADFCFFRSRLNPTLYRRLLSRFSLVTRRWASFKSSSFSPI